MPSTNGVQSVAERSSSAVDLVLHEIRRSILSGALVPGEPLIVQQLTAQLGVSHVPVREALRQLQGQGLIKLSRSKSPVVAPLNLADLQSIYRLRRCMEPELAAQSAAGRTLSDIDRLESLLEQIHSHFGTEIVWDIHREFHALLMSPAAGEWGLRFLNQLWDASERYTRLTFDPIDAPEEDQLAHTRKHQALLDAARSKAPEKMYEELRSHLQHNEQVTIARLEALTHSRT